MRNATMLLAGGIVAVVLILGGAATTEAAPDGGCPAPEAARQPQAALEVMLRGRGWSDLRIRVEEGCYEVDATDETGAQLEATFDPVSFRLLDVDTDADCEAPMAEWQPREALQALLEKRGWKVLRVMIDDGCYEVDAMDETGGQIEADFDPVTFRMLDLDVEEG